MSAQKHNQQLGRKGENLAAAYLQRRGYRILARNARTPYGEIDIVAKKGERYIFAEVKTRSTAQFGFPEEAITPQKWRHIVDSAEHWLEENAPKACDWQIDVIAILISPHGKPQIRHYENVMLA